MSQHVGSRQDTRIIWAKSVIDDPPPNPILHINMGNFTQRVFDENRNGIQIFAASIKMNEKW